MHQQIKAVIATMRKAGDHVYINFTQGQYTPLGKLLHNFYYRTNLTDVVDKTFIWGYPHHGGQHALTFKGPWKEAIAFVELWKEEMEKFNLNEEERQVNSQLSFISQELYNFR